MQETRKAGFYHVKYMGKWIIAEYYPSWSPETATWLITGNEIDHEDKDFDQINETRILNPDEENEQHARPADQPAWTTEQFKAKWNELRMESAKTCELSIVTYPGGIQYYCKPNGWRIGQSTSITNLNGCTIVKRIS